MLIDLHAHTYPRSYDAIQTPEELIAAAKKLGLGGVCLTEHDYFWESSELQSLAKGNDLLILPGCEVNTDDGHFLAFGLKQYVFGMHRLPFLRTLIDEAAGALVAAHPYRRRLREGLNPKEVSNLLNKLHKEETFSYVDAIEGLNGRGSLLENHFSQELSSLTGLSATGGGDSHNPGDLGACATAFDSEVASLQDLIRELKAGRFRPVSLRESTRETNP